MGQEGKQSCSIGSFNWLNCDLVTIEDDKTKEQRVESRLYAYSDFPVGDGTKLLLNRAARATDGVIAVDKIDNTKGVSFVLHLEPGIAENEILLASIKQQFAKNFRRSLRDAGKQSLTGEVLVVYSDIGD